MLKSILLAVSVFGLLCAFSGRCDAEVYFSGWVTSAGDVPDGRPAYQKNIPAKTHYAVIPTPAPKKKISDINKVIIVDPKKHTWSAYKNGKLLRSGLATAGNSWCPDVGRPCKTRAGSFRIESLGSKTCISSKYPLNEDGGAPMPYCMFFNGGQGIHGSNQVVARNVSHGCVRVHVSDARWIRFNFAEIGTKVVVKPY